MQNLEEAIRERAYHLWIANGQPEGKAEIYWLNAQHEILMTSVERLASTAATVDTVARKPSGRAGSFGPETQNSRSLVHRSPHRAGPDDAIMSGRGGSTSPLPLTEVQAVRDRYTSKELRFEPLVEMIAPRARGFPGTEKKHVRLFAVPASKRTSQCILGGHRRLQ